MQLVTNEITPGSGSETWKWLHEVFGKTSVVEQLSLEEGIYWKQHNFAPGSPWEYGLDYGSRRESSE